MSPQMCGCGLPITDPRAQQKAKPVDYLDSGRPIHADEIPVYYEDQEKFLTEDHGRGDLIEP